ncbi:anaerobic ribonucleoside-triphosphate reductase activating protein [Alkaliphilus transvaalensis]|uniref:anaerobic ribonucleoside-triphosphate reductase activating protein n=1 Tax=Alkaliphilus transvaalensis TaxID=114628 RepID=UPI00047AAAB0|nr:anaerobic ribonucleoside-triphosphate reductase activating protein [Alkaliphilus transvaalensis]
MNILGIEKSSFIDYPNRISTVVFTGGCNFSCPFCHNGHLLKEKEKPFDTEEVLNYIKKRKKFIDAVCVTGGEPTLQKNLKGFLKSLKEEGFWVKLDTNGTKPKLLKELIEEKLVDYIAMDLKAPLHDYSKVAMIPVDITAIKESINLIKNSGLDYEFRTTVCEELLKPEDLLNLAEEIKGAKKFYLQNFRDGDTVLGGSNQYTPYPKEVLKEIQEKIKKWFEVCGIR